MQALEQQLAAERQASGRARQQAADLERAVEGLRAQVLQAQAQHRQALQELAAQGEANHQASA